eukprot:TRINITY_DN469_c0_g1_i1.p1 TRINITY_DN469_c0_g1~~TRINITY_DN469_c0_g1_i1.p1  ORF type:complete len:833 (-),score=142.16 TRINITY_DN469_c0_g1_i1:142-2640(-)
MKVIIDAFVLVLLVHSLSVSCQQINATWIGRDGTWNNASNWDINVVPNNSSMNVYINGDGVNINISVPITINSLTLNGSFTILINKNLSCSLITNHGATLILPYLTAIFALNDTSLLRMYSGEIRLDRGAVYMRTEMLGTSSLSVVGIANNYISDLLFNSTGIITGNNVIITGNFTWTGRGQFIDMLEFRVENIANFTSPIAKVFNRSSFTTLEVSKFYWEEGDIYNYNVCYLEIYGYMTTYNERLNINELSLYSNPVSTFGNFGVMNFTKTKVNFYQVSYFYDNLTIIGDVLFDSCLYTSLIETNSEYMNATYLSSTLQISMGYTLNGNMTFVNSTISTSSGKNGVTANGNFVHENLILSGIDLYLNGSQSSGHSSIELRQQSTIVNYVTHKLPSSTNFIMGNGSYYLNYGLIDMQSSGVLNWTINTNGNIAQFINYGTIFVDTDVYFSGIDVLNCDGSLNIYDISNTKIYFESNRKINMESRINLIYDSQNQADTLNDYTIFNIRNLSNSTMDAVPTIHGNSNGMSFKAYPLFINASNNYLCWKIDVSGDGSGTLFQGVYNSTGNCIALNALSLCPNMPVPPTAAPVDPPVPTAPPIPTPTPTPTPTPVPTPIPTPVPSPTQATAAPSSSPVSVVFVNTTNFTNTDQSYSSTDVYFNQSFVILNSTVSFVLSSISTFVSDLTVERSRIKITDGSTLKVSGNLSFSNSSINLVLGSGRNASTSPPIAVSGCLNVGDGSKIEVVINMMKSTTNIPIISYSCSNRDVKSLVTLAVSNNCTSDVVHSEIRGLATYLYIPRFDCPTSSSGSSVVPSNVFTTSLLMAAISIIMCLI